MTAYGYIRKSVVHDPARMQRVLFAEPQPAMVQVIPPTK